MLGQLPQRRLRDILACGAPAPLCTELHGAALLSEEDEAAGRGEQVDCRARDGGKEFVQTKGRGNSQVYLGRGALVSGADLARRRSEIDSVQGERTVLAERDEEVDALWREVAFMDTQHPPAATGRVGLYQDAVGGADFPEELSMLNSVWRKLYGLFPSCAGLLPHTSIEADRPRAG
jgi:hypothetical protein